MAKYTEQTFPTEGRKWDREFGFADLGTQPVEEARREIIASCKCGPAYEGVPTFDQIEREAAEIEHQLELEWARGR